MPPDQVTLVDSTYRQLICARTRRRTALCWRGLLFISAGLRASGHHKHTSCVMENWADAAVAPRSAMAVV